MKYFHIIFFLIFLNHSNVFANKNPFNEFLSKNGFVQIEYQALSKISSEFQSDFKSYRIKNENNKLTVEENNNVYQSDGLFFEFNGYTFKGTNEGEWGGELTVNSQGHNNKILINDNIIEFIPVDGDSLFVFAGLAHSVSNRGTLYKINNFQKTITTLNVNVFSLLPEEPAVVLFDKSKSVFSILGFSGFTEIYLSQLPYRDKSFMKVYNIENSWGHLYPNSAIREGKYILIGMRHVVAVLKINHTKTNITYYLRAER